MCSDFQKIVGPSKIPRALFYRVYLVFRALPAEYISFFKPEASFQPNILCLSTLLSPFSCAWEKLESISTRNKHLANINGTLIYQSLTTSYSRFCDKFNFVMTENIKITLIKNSEPVTMVCMDRYSLNFKTKN